MTTTSGAADRPTEAIVIDHALQRDLLEFVNAEISIDPSTPIVGSTDLLLTGLVDSLGVVEIVAWLEERLDTAIDPVDIVLENFQTVDLMAAFAARLAARP